MSTRTTTEYVSAELRIDLNELATYWDSDVETVAYAELHFILIQLTVSLGNPGSCEELICMNIAGSTIARYSLMAVYNVRNLHLLLLSELSVPPFSLD